MFDVVNVVLVQMNRNHLHVSLIEGMSMVFERLCMYANCLKILEASPSWSPQGLFRPVQG
jgi:hypothetical protein